MSQNNEIALESIGTWKMNFLIVPTYNVVPDRRRCKARSSRSCWHTTRLGNKFGTTVGRQRVIGSMHPFSSGGAAEPQGDGFVTMPKKRDAPSGASRTIFNKTC